MSGLPENLSIRRARDNDLPEIARLHFAAYPGIPMTLDERISHFRDDPRIPLEDNWVCMRRDRLVGVFALYNFQMYRSGVVYPAGGIGRVAVAPEARLEKIAYWLMARAVEIMDQNAVSLSILYPFRHSFYRKLGWGIAEQVRSYRIDPSTIPLFPERSRMETVITNAEMEEVMACYQRFAESHNGLLVRDDPVWYEHIFKNCLTYAFRAEDTGEVEGYILYKYKPHSVATAFMVSDLIVREMIWTTDRAFRGIWGFLSSQRDQVKCIEYTHHSELPIEYILKDPQKVDGMHSMLSGAETASIGSGLMGRIVKLRKVFVAGNFGEGNGEVTIKIRDELNSGNAQPLTVAFENGKTDFPRKSSSDLIVSTDIATISSLYWGALSFCDALFLCLVEIECKGDTSFLETVLSFRRSICLDHF